METQIVFHPSWLMRIKSQIVVFEWKNVFDLKFIYRMHFSITEHSQHFLFYCESPSNPTPVFCWINLQLINECFSQELNLICRQKKSLIRCDCWENKTHRGRYSCNDNIFPGILMENIYNFYWLLFLIELNYIFEFKFSINDFFLWSIIE